MTLPHYESALIPKEKIFDYGFNMRHPRGADKAIAFEWALGYHQDSGAALIKSIRKALPEMSVVERTGAYGRQFSGVIELSGIDGRTAKARTCWQLDQGAHAPKLISIYVDK